MQSQLLKAKTFIKNLDQFGVVFKPSITQDTEYKTVLGGILSIILYGVSLGYFIYQFVQWKEGGMLPKITISSEVIVDQQIYFQDPILSIQMRKYGENSVDPFDPQNLIIMPLMIPMVNGLYTKPTLPNITKINNEEFTTVNFQNFTLGISSQRTTENPELGISIVLVDCVQSFLTSNMNCANITTRKKFFNQSVNTLFFTTYINQFNAQQEALNTFASQIALALDITSAYYATNTLKLQETIVDDGILFESTYQRDFILDIQTAGQQLNSKFFSGVINSTTYFINNYQLNGIKSIQYIQYPKINEVLADIGSIVSLLLLTSAFVIMTNQYWLENEALDKVIAMFYPNLKLIKFNKNWYGKVIGIDFQGKQLNIQKYNENYGKLKDIAQTKLTITNQIYEISRLQFIVQSVLPRHQFLYSHFIGIKENSFIENSINDDSQIENSSEFSRIKETRIQPSNETKIEIPSIQLAHDPSNLTADVTQENDQNIKNTANVPQNTNVQNVFELCDEDFELLISKQRTKPDSMSQFYEINKIN